MIGSFTKLSHTVRMMLFWALMLINIILLSAAGWLVVKYEEGDKEHG